MNKTPIQLSDHFDYPTLIRFKIPSVLMMVIAMMISCVGFMAGAGGSALVSNTLGEKQEDKARDQFSLIVYLILAFSLLVGLAVFIFVPELSGSS